MNPREALQNLDNVAAQYKGTRQEHCILSQSTMAIEALIKERENRLKAEDKILNEAKAKGDS